MVEISNVVNFGEGHAINYVTNAAREFRPDLPLSPDERVHLYVQHMYGRTKKHAG